MKEDIQSSKNMEKSVELIFIPTPGQGHLFSTIEMAKILLKRDERLSATILLIKLPTVEPKSDNNPISIPRLQLIDLPQDDAVKELMKTKPEASMFFFKLIGIQKSHVTNSVSERLSTNQHHHQLGGFIEVANEFGLPTYLYYTSNASMLSFILFIQEQVDEHNQDSSMCKDSDAMLSIPGFVNEVPISVFLSIVREGGFGHDMTLHMGRMFRNDVNYCSYALGVWDPLMKNKLWKSALLEKNFAGLANPEEVLPEGFLEMTKDTGRVIEGGHTRMAVKLSQLWAGCCYIAGGIQRWRACGVGTNGDFAVCIPEQQVNAFQMVKELEMAMDIKMDFNTDFHGNSLCFVTADEIESGIRKMMAMEGEEIEVMRKQVKEMMEKSREVVVEGGSSYTAIGALVNNIIDNIA
ncbi:hypothetical protein Leryth_024999 [Lithospermum erythrorhizon]|nr:hypothetical protein Leryth_024999 [Lithospermum erythrorhizon]